MFTQADSVAPAADRKRPRWRATTLRLEGGERVAVFETGRLDPTAPAIVLVHGMGHWTQAAWNALAPFFEATHRIVAFDLPGFGASEKPDVRYTLPYFTAALEAVANGSGLERFALVGHSYGGLIAANYAVRAPERVRALGLIDPAGFLRTPKIALRVAGSAPVAWLFRSIRPSAGFVNRTLDQSVFDPRSVPGDIREHAVELFHDAALTRAFARLYSGAMQELLHMRELHRRLAQWTGPTVLVWGKADRFVPIGALPVAAAIYPQAAVLEIDQCGHCPAIERPSLVHAALSQANF